jgi:hypothetical protein
MLRKTKAFAFPLLLVLIFFAIPNGAGGQSNDTELPAGDWTFSAHPDFRPDFETVPLYLYSVTTDSRSGLEITKIGLWNRTSKPVVSVKLQWMLTTEEDQNTPLIQGETQHIYFEKPFKEKSTKEIKPPVPSFAQVSRSMVSSATNKLEGNYRLDLAVCEANFEDGSTWVRSNNVIRKVGLFRQSPDDCGQRRCQKQQCFFDMVRGYICQDKSTCENCKRENWHTCINRSCFGPMTD